MLPKNQLPISALYTRPSVDPTALLLKAQELNRKKELPIEEDVPSFMPDSGQPKLHISDVRESAESDARDAAETERQLLEALAAQDAEILKLKQQSPPQLPALAGDESPPPSLPPRTKSPQIRTLSEYGFGTVDGASSATAAADIMADLALEVRKTRSFFHLFSHSL